MPGLRGGRYRIVVVAASLSRKDFDTNPRPTLERLAKVATEIYISDDEQRTIDLKVTKMPEDRP